MTEVIKSTLSVGLLFGLVFAAVTAVTGFITDYRLLVALPFVSGLLSTLGGIIASRVDAALEKRGFSNTRDRLIISFITAALFNFLIVFATLAYAGMLVFSREILIGILFGFAMGGVYSIYRYRMDRIRERVVFLEELAEKNRQLQDASRRLAITEERNRMGRELHDSISQGLHGILYSIHSLRRELSDSPQRVSAVLDHLEATVHSTLDELRAMIEELKPSLLAEEGLQEAIRVTAGLLSQRARIPVDLGLELKDPLAPETEMALYRIVQEALANVEKHASATKVTVTLSSGGGQVCLAVRDDGNGFDTAEKKGGNGLRNMAERARENGGDLQVISRQGLGTTVIASFPTKE